MVHCVYLAWYSMPAKNYWIFYMYTKRQDEVSPEYIHFIRWIQNSANPQTEPHKCDSACKLLSSKPTTDTYHHWAAQGCITVGFSSKKSKSKWHSMRDLTHRSQAHHCSHKPDSAKLLLSTQNALSPRRMHYQ